jgi:hypothetical protein
MENGTFNFRPLGVVFGLQDTIALEPWQRERDEEKIFKFTKENRQLA